MHRHRLIFALSAAALSLSGAGHARASFTLEGDAGALTLVADQVSRSEVVAAIVAKFGIETTGGGVEDGMVSGRFSGTLGHILKSILPRNGYALAYSNGRPVRVTFTGQSQNKGFDDPLAMGFAEQDLADRSGNLTPLPQPPESVIRGQAEQLAQQRILAPRDQNVEPTVPQASSGQAGTGQPDDMQREVAEATARALVQLKALTADLNRTGQ